MNCQTLDGFLLDTEQWGNAYENRNNGIVLPITSNILSIIVSHNSTKYTQALAVDIDNLKILSSATDDAAAYYVAICR